MIGKGKQRYLKPINLINKKRKVKDEDLWNRRI